MSRPLGDRSLNGGYKAAGVPVPTSTQSTDLYGLGDLSGYQVFSGTSTDHYSQSNSRDPSYDYTSPVYSGADEMVSSFAGSYGTDSYNELKGLLYGSGAYGAATYANVLKGGVDDDVKAYTNALTGYRMAAGGGYAGTFQEYLGSRFDSNYASGAVGSDGGSSGGGGSGGGGAISYTDPEAIKQTLNKAAQNAFGRAMSADELDAFVNEFHAMEGAAAYGGDQPNLSAQAVVTAKAAQPVEYNEYQTGLFAAVLSNLTGGGGSGGK